MATHRVGLLSQTIPFETSLAFTRPLLNYRNFTVTKAFNITQVEKTSRTKGLDGNDIFPISPALPCIPVHIQRYLPLCREVPPRVRSSNEVCLPSFFPARNNHSRIAKLSGPDCSAALEIAGTGIRARLCLRLSFISTDSQIILQQRR